MVFRDVTPGGFHWVWEASADGGATWQSRWEIDYRRSQEPEMRARRLTRAGRRSPV